MPSHLRPEADISTHGIMQMTKTGATKSEAIYEVKRD